MTKNILLLNNAYWPSIGGVENSLRHLAAEALKNGYSVKVLVSDIGLSSDSTQNLSELIDDVRVVRYPIYPIQVASLKWLNTFVSNWYLYSLLKAEYKACPTTIVIARFHICAVMAVFVGFNNVRYLIPSVITNQSTIELSLKSGIAKRIRELMFIKWHSYWQRLAIRRCLNFVFSKTMSRQCVAFSGVQSSNFILVRPGVDKVRFNPATLTEKVELRKKMGLPVDKKIVLFVGRFVKAKGCDLLIQAMPLISTNDCHLVLVGDGVEKNSYLELIERNLLTDKVSIFKSTRVVEEFYRCADIFVMCSRYEPLGQTILEAFSCGLPVVAFKAGPGVDTATQELGMDQFVWYSNELSKEGLADAIELCATNLHKVNRELISEQANNNFSWSALLRLLAK